MKCKKCGNEINNTVELCPYCGHANEESAKTNCLQEKKFSGKLIKEYKGTGRKKGVSYFIIILGLFLAVIGMLAFLGSQKMMDSYTYRWMSDSDKMSRIITPLVFLFVGGLCAVVEILRMNNKVTIYDNKIKLQIAGWKNDKSVEIEIDKIDQVYKESGKLVFAINGIEHKILIQKPDEIIETVKSLKA